MDESGTESTEELHFFYEEQSVLTFVECNGVKYHYIHNSHGDIVGIVDAAGNLVVEYKYDVWGQTAERYRHLENFIEQVESAQVSRVCI